MESRRLDYNESFHYKTIGQYWPFKTHKANGVCNYTFICSSGGKHIVVYVLADAAFLVFAISWSHLRPGCVLGLVFGVLIVPESV